MAMMLMMVMVMVMVMMTMTMVVMQLAESRRANGSLALACEVARCDRVLARRDGLQDISLGYALVELFILHVVLPVIVTPYSIPAQRDLRDRWKRRLVMVQDWLQCAAVLHDSVLPSGNPDPVSRVWASAIVAFVGATSVGKVALRAVVAMNKARTLPSSLLASLSPPPGTCFPHSLCCFCEALSSL